MKKLPEGIQNFQKAILEDYLYIDKTQAIYQLIKNGNSYFFSRPRRFGKSLLVSTLHEIFRGRRELFKGLWIDSSDYAWESYPVIHLDLSTVDASSSKALKGSLVKIVSDEAERSDVRIDADKETYPAFIFSNFVRALKKKFSSNVVILIDEYDKPLVHNLNDKELVQENKHVMQDFFSAIKTLDQHIKFVFITGVSKFSKVSLFSGMNNLTDISLYDEYASLVGLTDEEIRSNLEKFIQRFAIETQEESALIYEKLKAWYNGYKFSRSESAPKVFNPVSVFKCLNTKNFDNFWFTTATPTFVIDLIKYKNFSVSQFEEGILAGSNIEDYYEAETIDLHALLFQTGYLTISSYDRASRVYLLKFPNKEVEFSFLEHLLKRFVGQDENYILTLFFSLRKFLQELDFEQFFDVFNTLFTATPYQIHVSREAYYHSFIYMILKVFGFDVDAEVSTSQGRIDMVLKAERRVFIFEFKIDRSAEEALKQIQKREYYEKFRLEEKEIVLVGANFNSKQKKVDSWKVVDLF